MGIRSGCDDESFAHLGVAMLRRKLEKKRGDVVLNVPRIQAWLVHSVPS